MRNQNGSVLSVAVVIFVIISFVLTATSVYTADVMNRTNVMVNNEDENIFARRVIRLVVEEIVSEIESDLARFGEQFTNEDADLIVASLGFDKCNNENLEEGSVAYNLGTLVERYYEASGNHNVSICDVLEITYNSGNVMVFSVSFRLSTDNTLRRQLLIEPTFDSDAGTGGGTGSFNNFEEVSNAFLNCKPTEDQRTCAGNHDFNYINYSPNTATADFRAEFRNATGNRDTIQLTDNAFIGNGINTLKIDLIGSGRSSWIDLNGNILVIEGSLSISDVARIRSDNPNGMGIIIIGGNLYINETHQNKLRLDNVIIIVKGNTYDETGSLEITARNSHLITLSNPPFTADWFESNTSLGSNTYKKDFSDDGYFYVGSDPNYSLGDIVAEIGLSSSFSFSYVESSFEIEAKKEEE